MTDERIGRNQPERRVQAMDQRDSTPTNRSPGGLSRRKFLRAAAALVPTGILAACGRRAPGLTAPTGEPAGTTAHPFAAETKSAPVSAAAGQVAPPTPACGDDHDLVVEQAEGPFFTPDSPERTSLLEEGMVGTNLVVSGVVMTTACEPVGHALLDFWHADDGGTYDNVGYTLRGHQYTDAAGRYTLTTVLPGLYTGRTRHIHVKVQAADQPVLTTQLYFPDEPSNATDGIFDPRLVMNVQPSAQGKTAAFDFVVTA